MIALVASVWIAAQLLGASVPGHLAPTARGPLQNGVHGTPYRWVEPPPELAASNQAPSAGEFTIELGPEGSLTAVVTTDDAQVTLVVPEGSIPPSPDDRELVVQITPLAADAVGSPATPLQIAGNVYEISGTYMPSGDRVGRLASPSRVVLAYPHPSGPSTHTVMASVDGLAWTEVDTNDLPSVLQAEGPIDAFGYVAVAREASTPPPVVADDRSEGLPTWTLVLAIGLAVLSAGALIATRGSREVSRPARGAGRGSRPSRSRSSRKG